MMTGVEGAAGLAPNQRRELREAAKGFEAVFVRQMIGAMRAAHLAEDPLESEATGQFRSMMDARLADGVAAKGRLGIAEMLLRQFEGPGAERPDGAAE